MDTEALYFETVGFQNFVFRHWNCFQTLELWFLVRSVRATMRQMAEIRPGTSSRTRASVGPRFFENSGYQGPDALHFSVMGSQNGQDGHVEKGPDHAHSPWFIWVQANSLLANDCQYEL